MGKSIFQPLLRHDHIALIHEEVMVDDDEKEQYSANPLFGNKITDRPAMGDLYDGNISINPSERKEHRRRASQKLELALSQRPTFSDVVERGILMNENDNFNERIRELVLLINSAQNLMNSHKSKMYQVADEIKNDYMAMSSRLNDQIFEYKQTLNQFQVDVHSREQRLRTELETKQRVLLHMNGIAEQQKHDQMIIQSEYEEKLRVLEQKLNENVQKDQIENEIKSNDDNEKLSMQIKQCLEYVRSYGNNLQSELLIYAQQSQNNAKYQQLQQQKMHFINTIDQIFGLSMSAMSNSASSTNHAVAVANDQNKQNQQMKNLETKIKKQQQQINKLKHQKKEMVKMVNNKMTDLKFYHQQELQKERQIANVLVENHKNKYQALLDRSGYAANGGGGGDQRSYEMMQMKQQMERMKEMMRKILVENDSLKKSKKNLEKMVMKLSSDIVQTANKR